MEDCDGGGGVALSGRVLAQGRGGLFVDEEEILSGGSLCQVLYIYILGTKLI